MLFVYFFVGLFLYSRQGPVTSGVFFLLCLPMYFLYSYFERKQYFKHFTRYINANYKNEIGATTSISIDNEGVSVALAENTHTLYWSNIEIIIETISFILIQEKNQDSILIPKEKTNQKEALIAELKKMSSSHDIPYQEELDWKWK